MSDPYGPFNIQSGKVTKKALESTGKTAHRDQWFKAPSDSFFVEGSWAIKTISAGGKNAAITIVRFKRKIVEITLPSGAKIDHQFVTAFLVSAHAETGSGKSLSDKTAWAEGEVSAEIQEFK